MRLIEEILADINKAKAKVTSVELEIGHTTGVSSQINRLIQAQNLLTYCHSRLSDIDPESLRQKGEWVENGRCNHKPCRIKNPEKWVVYKCSVCGYGNGRKRSNFCPSCGADMRGGTQ